MKQDDYENLMKRCQIGCHRLGDANDLLAECYGAIGLLRSLADNNYKLRKITPSVLRDLENFLHDEIQCAKDDDPSVGIFANHEFADALEIIKSIVEETRATG